MDIVQMVEVNGLVTLTGLQKVDIETGISHEWREVLNYMTRISNLATSSVAIILPSLYSHIVVYPILTQHGTQVRQRRQSGQRA